MARWRPRPVKQKFFMFLSHPAVAEAAGISEADLQEAIEQGKAPAPALISDEEEIVLYGIREVADWLDILEDEIFDLIDEDEEEET